MSERLDVEVDQAVTSYLRRCHPRASLAAAAGAQLRQLALTDAVRSLAAWDADGSYTLASLEEQDAALHSG